MTRINVEVTLETKTCDCGLVYAVPYWLLSYQCPKCAGRKIIQKSEEAAENWTRYQGSNKHISHLRGVITRLKNRKAKESV